MNEHQSLTPSFHYLHGDNDGPALGPNTTPDELKQHLVYLQEQGHAFLTCAQAIKAAETDSLPENSVVLSFDDGLRSQFKNAFPILRELGVPATFFIIAGGLEGRLPPFMALQALLQKIGPEKLIKDVLPGKQGFARSYNLMLQDADAPVHMQMKGPEPPEFRAIKTVVNHFLHPIVAAAILGGILVEEYGEGAEQQEAENRFISVSQLKEMTDSGMEIGAHTVIHPDFTMFTLQQIGDELEAGAAQIEAQIGVRPTSFAYPFGGRFSPEIQGLVAEIYDSGWNFVTSQDIPSPRDVARNMQTNRFDIPRADGSQMLKAFRGLI